MSLTPMLQQYMELKQAYPEALLLFRLGDFYELFFDDAMVASRALEITLTSRDAGSAGRIPMCGVPYHAADQYIARLIDQGYVVAVCEQVEDPKTAKGLVKREVVRVITPGTFLAEDGTRNRFLASVVGRGGVWGAGFIDVGTGEVWYLEHADEQMLRERMRAWQPAEVLVYEGAQLPAWLTAQDAPWRLTRRPDTFAAEQAAVEALCTQYGVANLVPLDLTPHPVAAHALGLAVMYIRETQRAILPHLRTPRNLLRGKHLVLDETAVRNLELLETVRTRQRKGSLYGLLDETETAMGSRLLRRWIERPLCDKSAIEARLDAIAWLVDNALFRMRLKASLHGVYDLDRLLGKVAFGSANPRDLLALAHSVAVLPDIRGVLQAAEGGWLAELAQSLPNLADLTDEITRTLVDDPPVSPREGGIIRPGVDPLLDRLRDGQSQGAEWLLAFERQERERTGIKSLKVGYHKVFGYFIEVSKANLHLVPPEYERKQTLANAERYTVPALKAAEAEILDARERALAREYELFSALREHVLARQRDIQAAAEALACLDVLTALATVAAQRRYVRPVITEERAIRIRAGRHPVVEAMVPGRFVPNDVQLDDEQPLILITGPNMAGKSTYMRQTALIAIMAHMGSFVPAEAAEIGLLDRVFTRIGASDDLSAGQSTFMVEMVELAHILRQATDRSLVLLDEIGRGTSTYDGLSIAEAVMEALLQPGRNPLTLFASHYHELTEVVAELPGAANYSVLVAEDGQDITFLHTVVPRPADKSYGIQVAKLAGIPADVIARAQALLAVREGKAKLAAADGRTRGAGMPDEAALQASEAALQASAARESVTPASAVQASAAQASAEREGSALALLRRLAEMDIEHMTPIAAIHVLAELREAARSVL
ncbi:DNA mismatch repair protein MutS [Alicyclobacillus cellulosilyticus]|uniref:DNA mismatch repair protein MutS n=1 Tax=Alicyclobacillus cellulosilyticus TaxID=1003997 RepID=A0A917K956_9BACL|nr:DNA mismatch repair protein MutS [Alicyclobacillus cellulosilyticus]GGJ04336.1 DNA mismatch repair protein MutS [Alicyclobacillus cellulosilyticus]